MARYRYPNLHGPPIVTVPRHVEILREVLARPSLTYPPNRRPEDAAAWKIIDERKLIVRTTVVGPGEDSPWTEYMAWKVTPEGERAIDAYRVKK